MEEKYTLDDLNELSGGLGDSICFLLDRVCTYYNFLDVKKSIKEMLLENNIGADEVLMTKGLASGMTISEAFVVAEKKLYV